ncbi:MAG TPA: class I SAM-dependent methyltransferase [Thermomicrobiales bacterium]|nr:class I SAM-dependent methyltransferase [Thermomicrobiales bacterium]
MRPTDPTYSRYARHYDQIGQRRFGESSARDLLRLFALQGDHPSSVLDLACGTGAATITFARHGLEVTGLDISRAMLDEAERAAKAAGVAVRWILGDMTAFETEHPYDLCTCFYDAVNYLADLREFTAFARCAFAALAPGGHFAFDINTRRKLAEHWGQMTLIAANDSERFLTYRSWFDERHGVSPLIITGFERRPDGAWDRFDEEHVEVAFAIEDLRDKLESVGFVGTRIIDWREGDISELAPGTEDSFRVLFLAEKPAG